MIGKTIAFNPYDFANPVVDPDIFVGREKELAEVDYYLDQALKTNRPINLAVLGTRASGKTSFLNMIEQRAKKKGFLPVRIDLDEGDIEAQLPFFYKIFDSVLTTACSEGAFGGRNGKTYQIYRDMIDAYEIPDGKEFCPFIFPMQYAKCMSAGNISAPLSETNFRQDLVVIEEEIKLIPILLLDECDVLTKSRVHLEKLRNVFMNMRGFMVVLTGSPVLFPLMNDVFSPIIRQFKKIYLEPFKEKRDTEHCIQRPLEKNTNIDYSAILDSETYLEIHNLSGGRPYEIQLICHIMLRRVQEKRSKRMELTLDVLDEIRKELESFQDVATRPVLTAIRSFDNTSLSALELFSQVSGYANIDQIWFAEFIFHGKHLWTKAKLESQLKLLQSKGILSIQDDISNFAGDDFDRIYAKYFARVHNIYMSTFGMPWELYLRFELSPFIESEIPGVEAMLFGLRGSEEIDLQESEDHKRQIDGAKGFRSIQRHIREDVNTEYYKAQASFRGARSFEIVDVTIKTP